MTTTTPTPPRGRRLARAAGTLAVAAALLLAGLMLGPPLLGLQRYVITGGSMEGSISRGSIVFDRAVPVADLRVGDVITYEPPNRAWGRVTHRIVRIGRGPHGERRFRTRGDANPSPDPWSFRLAGPTQARVAFHVPVAGYAFAALGIRPVRMALIGLPAILVALSVLVGLVREAREEAAAPRPEEVTA